MKKLMTNADYHTHEAIGSSLLKQIASSGLFKALKSEFKQTEAMILGSAFHSLLLEPETFDNEYAVAPKVDRRTKQGKSDWADFQEASEGKTVIDMDTYDKIRLMKEEILGHSLARSIIQGGHSEYSYFATDNDTALELKCRPDIFNKGSLIDVKTTSDASPDGFAKQISNLNYHLQAAFYSDVFAKATGEKVDNFIFIAIETKAPFAIGIYSLDEASMHYGRELYKAMLKEYKNYKTTGIPLTNENHGYTKGIMQIEVPVWKFQKDELRIGGAA